MAGTRILVIKLGALGDFIQALGPMAAIRRHHPEAEITLLTTKPFVEMAKACGYFDNIWIDDRPRWPDIKGWLSLRRRLNGGGFSRVYDLQNNDRTAFYLRLFKRRHRPEWVGVAPGASHRNIAPDRTAGLAFDGHVQTLALAGIKDISVDDLSWIKGDIHMFDVRSPFILVVPGSAPAHPYKRWPAARYAELMTALGRRGYSFVVLGTDAEKGVTAEICASVPQCLDLTGKTSLFDIAVLARHAAGAIGNDTGPMHIIAPTGCPSIVLFSGHSNPDRHAPKGLHVRTLRHEPLSALPVETVLKETGGFKDPRQDQDRHGSL